MVREVTLVCPRHVVRGRTYAPLRVSVVRVQQLLPAGALEQESAPYEHESNGVIENGVGLGKGLLRVQLLALEATIGGRLPTTLAAFAWLVAFAPDILTKYRVGGGRQDAL